MSALQAPSFPFASVDLTRMWADFKLPMLNVEALVEAQRKNAAALTNAHQIAFEGLQALAQRHSDLIKATVDDYSQMTGDIFAAASLEERAARQADAARHAFTSSVAGMRELSDIAVKANVAASDVLNARIVESFDEAKALFTAAPAAARATVAAVIAAPIDAAVAAAAPADVPLAEIAPEPTPAVPEPPAPVVAAPKTVALAPRPPRRPTTRR